MNWLLVKQLWAGRWETISLFADVGKMILQQLNVSHLVICNTRAGSCITIPMENATDIGNHAKSKVFVIRYRVCITFFLQNVIHFGFFLYLCTVNSKHFELCKQQS